MAKFIFNVLETVKTEISDYKKLAPYHYQTGTIKPVTNIYKIKARGRYVKNFPDPIAVIVYRMPLIDLRARTNATNGFFKRPTTRSKQLKLVNKHIRYLARIIVDPRFRKLGIATKLILDTLHLQDCPIIETVTPIDFTNNLFLKTGFQLHFQPQHPRYTKFENALLSTGLTDHDLSSPETVQKRIDKLGTQQSKYIESQINQFIHTFRRQQNMPPGIERTKFVLSKLAFPSSYLIWFNPKFAIADEIAGKDP